jgi:ribosomal protein S18 acetylase RimI-like enzyme
MQLLQLRKINTASFPIQYNENFYHDILKRNNASLNKFAYYKEFIVGAVCCRIEDVQDKKDCEEKKQKKRLYIMTLAVLAAYRGRGIGSKLLQSILDYCGTVQVDEITLHVQISNQGAIRFYTERFQFEQGDMVENYYRRIDPPHCYVLYKDMRPTNGNHSSKELPETSSDDETKLCKT